MQVIYEAACSSLPWYLTSGRDVIGQSSVVAMPTTGAPTPAVVYLSPVDTYRQWVPPMSPVTEPLVPVLGGGGRNKGHYPVTAWPQLTANDRLVQVTGWTRSGSGIPAVPYSYYQQPGVSSSTSVSNECLLTQQMSVSSLGIPSPAVLHHDTVIQPLNPSDQSADNPLVVSTK